MRKFLNVFDFFKTTLAINFAVCLCAVVFGGLEFFYISFLSFGFVLSILFKEVYRKSDYLFYSNNGVSKRMLLFSSYIMTFGFAVLMAVFVILIKKLL